jgi:hypothetical protein
MQPQENTPPGCPPRPGGSPGLALCRCLPRRAGSVQRHRLLARASQLSPGGVEVTLGTLGPAAQLATRLLEHLGA